MGTEQSARPYHFLSIEDHEWNAVYYTLDDPSKGCDPPIIDFYISACAYTVGLEHFLITDITP